MKDCLIEDLVLREGPQEYWLILILAKEMGYFLNNPRLGKSTFSDFRSTIEPRLSA